MFYSSNSAITCGKEKKYESSFNFLDLANNILSVVKKVGTGIVYLWSKTMKGFEIGGNDITCIINDPKKYFSELIPPHLSSCIHCQDGQAKQFCPSCSPNSFNYDKFLEIRSKEINQITQDFFISVSDFIEQAKDDPLIFAGDALSWTSRTLANVAFYSVLYFSLINPLVTGAAAIGSTIASVAKDLFGSELVSVVSNGTATLQASPSLSGLSEGVGVIANEVIQSASLVSKFAKELTEVTGASVIGGNDKIEKIEIGKAEKFTNLKYIGDGKWKSSKGLIYGYDKKFGNRIQHVLSHASNNPNKINHTVFNSTEDEILKLIDEAWSMRSKPLSSDPGAFVIDMKRAIGTNGETAIKIIIKPETAEIITAYPLKL